jgi:outer membrane protein assembly factor BamD (BamD/ComL family)
VLAPRPAPAPPPPTVIAPQSAAVASQRPAAPRALPSPPVVVPPTPVASAEDLYRDAEAAMRAGKPRAAGDALAQLIERHPGDPLVDAARYERARLAFAAGEWTAAQLELDALAAHPRDAALVEPAAYLRCRVAYARRAPDAASCVAAHRARFPGSVHDAELLALLAALRFADGCAAAAPLLEEYLARYPSGPFARDARAGRDRCR